MSAYYEKSQIDAVYEVLMESERTEIKNVHDASNRLAPDSTPSFEEVYVSYGDIGWVDRLGDQGFNMYSESSTLEVFKKAHILSFICEYGGVDPNEQLSISCYNQKDSEIIDVTRYLLKQGYWGEARNPGKTFPAGYHPSYNAFMLSVRPDSEGLGIKIVKKFESKCREHPVDINEELVAKVSEYLNSFNQTNYLLSLYTHELDHFLMYRDHNTGISDKIDEIFGWAIKYYVEVKQGNRDHMPTSLDEASERIGSYAETDKEELRMNAMIALIEHKMTDKSIKSRYKPIDWIRRREWECIKERVSNMSEFIEVMFPKVRELDKVDNKVEEEVRQDIKDSKKVIQNLTAKETIERYKIPLDEIDKDLQGLINLLENPEISILNTVSKEILSREEIKPIDIDQAIKITVKKELKNLKSLKSDLEDLKLFLSKKGYQQQANKIEKLSGHLDLIEESLYAGYID